MSCSCGLIKVLVQTYFCLFPQGKLQLDGEDMLYHKVVG